MNTNAIQEPCDLLPADSVAFRWHPPGPGSKTRNPPLSAHLRWGEAMYNREWSWGRRMEWCGR